MPALNRLPIGGGADVGINDGQGIINLNIFTQTTEPEIKDGIWIKTNNKYQKVMINQKYINYETGVWSSASTLPYEAFNSGAIVYDNQIHIFGGQDSSSSYPDIRTHYKWNGSTWTKLSNLPIDAYIAKAVLYNNEIHTLFSIGLYSSDNTYHYKFNGSTWSKVSTLPYTYSDALIIYNGYLLVSNPNDGYLYKLNGTTWEKYISYKFTENYNTSNIPLEHIIIYNGYIYTFSNKYYYKYNGSSWSKNDASVLPYNFSGGSVVVYNSDIHLLGGDYSNNGEKHYHYKFNGSTFSAITSKLPYNSFYGGNALVYNGALHMLSGCRNSRTMHYKFEAPENVYDKNTVIINKGTTNNGTYLTNISNTSIIDGDGKNNRFPSGFDDVFYFVNTAFDWDAEMYYGDGTKWIKFKN